MKLGIEVDIRLATDWLGSQAAEQSREEPGDSD
jgi:hypothetical protein